MTFWLHYQVGIFCHDRALGDTLSGTCPAEILFGLVSIVVAFLMSSGLVCEASLNNQKWNWLSLFHPKRMHFCALLHGVSRSNETGCVLYKLFVTLP